MSAHRKDHKLCISKALSRIILSLLAARLLAPAAVLSNERDSLPLAAFLRSDKPITPVVAPFWLSRGIIVIVPGRIGALRNLRFALDTGTTQTVIDTRLARQLGLHSHAHNQLLNFDRSVSLKQCTLPELEVGSLQLNHLSAGVADLSELSELLNDVDAIIGLDVLGASKFTIDYTSQTIIFEEMHVPLPPPASDPNDPIILMALIRVQGQPLRVIIDTGAQGLFLYEQRFRNRVPALRTIGQEERVNIGKALFAKRVAVPGVQLGNTETTRSLLLIPGPPKGALQDIDGFLGVSVLGARQVTLDFIGKTLSWR